MAIMKHGSLTEEIRGTISSTTFRKVGARTILSQKSTGPTRPGKNSGEHLQYMKEVAHEWLYVSDDLKKAWQIYYADNKITHPWTERPFHSAKNLFQFYNVTRRHCGLTSNLDTLETPLFDQDADIWGTLYRRELPFQVNGHIHIDELTKGMPIPSNHCIFASLVKKGAPGPSKWVRKLNHTSGDMILNSDKYIWERFGYPPGLNGLITQPQPDTVECWIRGIAYRDGYPLSFSIWRKMSLYDTFVYPPT